MKSYARVPYVLFGGLTIVGLFGCCARQAPTAAPIAAPTAAAPSPSAAANDSANAPSALANATEPSSFEALVDAPDRSAEDRALDGGRHPVELLKFLDLKPGMKVAEISAGGGYTTELLARAVGPSGTVYGQNSRFVLERFAEGPWSQRLQKPVMKNVIRVDREFDDPLPPEAHDLDAVIDVLFYHDTVWMKTDRAKMNQAIFGALRRGGIYVIVDHSAKQGSGTTDAQTNHRIEESIVRDEVGRAGFRLQTSADFLRNPLDSRDWNASPRVAGERRGTSDRFVLKFVKP